ncbi:MAG: hypothetical protein F6K19_44650 [Cyanothece sp. SIO1E1]|nr:hypothetical protein [Cyanothece sp. SIO1E1]
MMINLGLNRFGVADEVIRAVFPPFEPSWPGLGRRAAAGAVKLAPGDRGNS